ncbi:MFS transporter [Halocalculus aciditolerans]|uniref:MFS transporter n=1 Tax=Halocalculus aciditolerans TaxID=1383812 RepID=A0A830FFC1_9EURY|nr:MFS transporter [Halocalculus aciditolerans]GGL69425.1 MFS transporter [Halocalculus aciditolerans]
MSLTGRLDAYPTPVLATAFATFVAFLGIGVVDPILPKIGQQMGASHAMVELLFSSYILVMALAMLVSGALSTRIGSKNTVLLGMALVAGFAALCGLAPDVLALAVLRGGWGFGNALFTSTALAIIVGLSTEVAEAILLYEAALGLGIAAGPLLGGVLGSASWRIPFFGTAVLMAVGFLTTYATVSDPETREEKQTVRDVLAGYRSDALRTNALVGLTYSFGFFTILAYSPLTVADLTSVQLGVVYFAWGALVAVSSVFLSTALIRRFGEIPTLGGTLVGMMAVLAAAGLTVGTTALLAVIVLSGVCCGVANALFTTLAIESSPHSRAVSSAAYNCLRWAGAAVAPVLAGYLGQTYGLATPFYLAAAVVLAGTLYLLVRGSDIRDGLRANASAGHASAGD